MSPLFRLPAAVPRDPEVEAWFEAPHHDLRRLLARPWFDRLRALGPDVRERLHDNAPTACLGDVAFAYVAAFTAHVNLGFFHGADLPDPAGLLQGTGKRMRHVKLRWGEPADEAAVEGLIGAAYGDVRRRVGAE